MVYPALMNFPEIMICGFHVGQTYTVEPCLRATSVIQSPHTVTRLIQPIFLGLLVTLLTGFHCNYFFVLCRDRKIVPKGLCGSWKNLIWYFELWKRRICNESLLCDIFLWRFHLAVFKSLLQLAKKVVSDSSGLADFAIRLGNSVFKLPDQQVMFFEEFESQKNCETNSVSQNVFWASWNDISASKC